MFLYCRRITPVLFNFSQSFTFPVLSKKQSEVCSIVLDFLWKNYLCNIVKSNFMMTSHKGFVRLILWNPNSFWMGSRIPCVPLYHVKSIEFNLNILLLYIIAICRNSLTCQNICRKCMGGASHGLPTGAQNALSSHFVSGKKHRG